MPAGRHFAAAAAAFIARRALTQLIQTFSRHPGPHLLGELGTGERQKSVEPAVQ